jgi:O-antigen ligase
MPPEMAGLHGGRDAWICALATSLIALTQPIEQLYSLSLWGGIDVSLQTLALMASVSAFAIGLLREPSIRVHALYLFSPLLAWVWFESIRSVDVGRAMTYLLLLALCGALYAGLAIRDPRLYLKRVNRRVFWIGSAVTLVLFARYLYLILFKGAAILGNPYLWDVGSGDVYEVQFGGVIAYQGFGGDPNAVGIATAIILFCGMNLRFRRLDWMRHVINALLIAVMLASNSRGAMAALIASLIIGSFLGVPYHRRYLGIIVALGAALWAFAARNAEWLTGLSNPLEKLQRGSGRRFHEWSYVFDSFADQPFIGGGVRFSEALLGKYTENSYLTLLADTGFVGFFAYCIAVGTAPVLFVGFGRHRRIDMKDVMPWLVYSVFLLTSMLYISMEVKPIVWVTVGTLTGALLARGSQRPAPRSPSSRQTVAP